MRQVRARHHREREQDSTLEAQLPSKLPYRSAQGKEKYSSAELLYLGLATFMFSALTTAIVYVLTN